MNHALQGLRRTFQALSYHDFRLFWIGQLISLTGTWMQSIAQSWLVLELTRSSFVLGMVSALGMLPVLFFALPAGAIADGVDKRRLLMVTQSAMMGLALILAVLTSTGNVRVWQIVALAVLLGLANAFDQPGRQAFVIELVGREDLLNAVALNSAAFNTARILGPALAGILIGTLGIAACFYLNGLSFVAVIVGLGLIRTSFTPERPAAESIFEDMLDGLKYIRQDRRILTLIVLVGVFSIFGLPYLVLMPVVARSVLKCGPGGYSLMMSATGIGALAGALTLASLGNTRHKGRLVMLSGIVFVAFLNLLAVSRSLPVSALILVVLGFTMVSQAATTNSLLQSLAPDELRGRVMSVFGVMFLGVAPLGSLQAGLVAQHFGAPAAFVIGGSALALALVFVLLRRREVLAL